VYKIQCNYTTVIINIKTLNGYIKTTNQKKKDMFFFYFQEGKKERRKQKKEKGKISSLQKVQTF